MAKTFRDGVVGRAFTSLCWEVGTPFAYKALLALKREDWGYLTTAKVAIAGYTCARTLSGDLQIAAFLKKYPGFDLGRDLDAESIDSFWKTEHMCFRSNERLSPLLHDQNHYGERIGELIRRWRKETRELLGRVPSLSRLKCKFGPGSTFLNVGDEITVAHKLSENYSYTRQASFVLSDWDLSAWSRSAAAGLWSTPGGATQASLAETELFQIDAIHSERLPEIVRGNRFTTVPKDATKHRGICIEPSINVFYQLGVGSWIAGRLRRWGWDKRSAQIAHKNLAQIGSLTGAISTIDLSSASDTICSNLVELLLPREWFGLLNQLRSPFSRVNGRWVKLEKFSSMGNGFTFELETLLFWGLARALSQMVAQTEDPYTPGVTTSVFGDDIIIPSSLSKDYLAAIKFFGFKANTDKTFTKGRFRESCGGDFFNGMDVRPHYVKNLCNEPSEIISLANGLRRFRLRYRLLGGGDLGRRTWFGVLDALPNQIRACRGPELLGDLVVHDSPEVWENLRTTRTRNSIRYLRVWRPCPNRKIGWDHFRPGVVLAVALYGASSGAPSSYSDVDLIEGWRRSGMVPRIRGSYVSGYRFGRVPCS